MSIPTAYFRWHTQVLADSSQHVELQQWHEDHAHTARKLQPPGTYPGHWAPVPHTMEVIKDAEQTQFPSPTGRLDEQGREPQA